ncbi:MAG: hypothetical protein LM590_04415 [Thermofilum sp.]|nr:hypothetical protein [Thermofilum sp.]
MQWKTLLVALIIVIVVVLALASFFFVFHPKAPSQPTIQPAVNTTQPQPAQNVAQTKTKPPTIIATIETSGGGRVLANGTGTATWSLTAPFTIELEAIPDECMAFTHWFINGSYVSQQRLSLRIAGNTTIKAFFTKPQYTLTIKANITGARAIVNGHSYDLPVELPFPACSHVVVEPGIHVNAEALNKTISMDVTRDTTITLYYRQLPPRWYQVPIVANGTTTPVRMYATPLVKNNGTIEATSDGWIHLKGTFVFLEVYVPWNLTHVTVEVRNATQEVQVLRFCDWGMVPFAYGDMLRNDRPKIYFNGCQCTFPYRPETSQCSIRFIGGRYPDDEPGMVSISVDGEAWVRIQASP